MKFWDIIKLWFYTLKIEEIRFDIRELEEKKQAIHDKITALEEN